MSTRRRFAVAALALVSLLVLAACGGNDDAADVAAVDADALLERAATRIEAAGSFRFTLDHENGAAEILNGLLMRSATGEVAGPNEMALEVDAQAGPLAVKVSIIALPDQSWVTNPLTGRWEREDLNIEAFFDPAGGVTALMRGISGAQITGTDSVDGVATYVVEATVDSGDLALFAQGAPSGTPLAAKAWIGVEDPLVYRIEIVGGISAGEPAELVRRLTLKDWGAEIAIAPPR